MPRRISQGRGLSSAVRDDSTTPNYSVNHARSGSDSCSALTAPLVSSISPLHAAAIVALPRIFMTFRGLKAQSDPVAKLVQCGEPFSPSARMAPQAVSRASRVSLTLDATWLEPSLRSQILSEIPRLSPVTDGASKDRALFLPFYRSAAPAARLRARLPTIDAPAIDGRSA